MSLISFIRDADEKLFNAPHGGGAAAPTTTAAPQPDVAQLNTQAGAAIQVDDQLTVAQASQPAGTFHTVQKGDTLSKIAKEVYGDANAYPQIFEANRPMLKDPDKIYPGQVLRIPPKG